MFKALIILALIVSSSVAMTADLQAAATKPIAQAAELSDESAGYDQAAYDECMDQTDTTASDCEAI